MKRALSVFCAKRPGYLNRIKTRPQRLRERRWKTSRSKTWPVVYFAFTPLISLLGGHPAREFQVIINERYPRKLFVQFGLVQVILAPEPLLIIRNKRRPFTSNSAPTLYSTPPPPSLPRAPSSSKLVPLPPSSIRQVSPGRV